MQSSREVGITQVGSGSLADKESLMKKFFLLVLGVALVSLLTVGALYAASPKPSQKAVDRAVANVEVSDKDTELKCTPESVAMIASAVLYADGMNLDGAAYKGLLAADTMVQKAILDTAGVSSDEFFNKKTKSERKAEILRQALVGIVQDVIADMLQNPGKYPEVAAAFDARVDARINVVLGTATKDYIDQVAAKCKEDLAKEAQSRLELDQQCLERIKALAEIQSRMVGVGESTAQILGDPKKGIAALYDLASYAADQADEANAKFAGLDATVREGDARNSQAIRQLDKKVQKVDAENKNQGEVLSLLNSDKKDERKKGLGLLYLARGGKFNNKEAKKQSTRVTLPNPVDVSVKMQKAVLPEGSKDCTP